MSSSNLNVPQEKKKKKKKKLLACQNTLLSCVLSSNDSLVLLP